MKTKSLRIHLTESEHAVVAAAAKRADKTVSRFGAELVLGALLESRRKNPEMLDAIANFQRLFCEVMELSVTGKLTEARLKGVVERRVTA